jgi:PAS domain S-box-containing protein
MTISDAPSDLPNHEPGENDLPPVATLAPDLHVRRLTSAWSRLRGSDGAFAGPFLDLLVKEDAETARVALALVTPGSPRVFDARVRPHQWIRFYARREASGDLEVTGLDITDLKRAQARAAHDHELLEAVVERCTAGIVVTDDQGRWLRANAWFRKKAGIKRDDVRGETFLMLLPPEAHEGALESHKAFFTTGENANNEWQVTDTEGNLSTLAVSSTLVSLSTGERYRLSTMADITAIRGQKARLAIFAKVLESAPLVLWALDRDGIFTLAEGKGLAAFGSSPGAWVGRDALEDWKHTPAYGNMKRALAGEEYRDTLTTPGPIHQDIWYLPLRDAHGNPDGMIGLALDVTKERIAEAELREKLELIERQNETIRQLATPMMKVWDGVLCLPLIGVVDSRRAADIMDSLLQTIVAERIRFAIVDLTGVGVVDTTTADHLIRLFNAAKLVGAEGVLCGIQPAVAQTVVALGTELGHVVTARTLADALNWCIVRSRATESREGRALPGGSGQKG